MTTSMTFMVRPIHFVAQGAGGGVVHFNATPEFLDGFPRDFTIRDVIKSRGEEPLKPLFRVWSKFVDREICPTWLLAVADTTGQFPFVFQTPYNGENLDDVPVQFPIPVVNMPYLRGTTI